MNRKEMIAEVARRTDFDKKDTEKILDCFLTLVGEELRENRKIRIAGFGRFETRDYLARTGRNPKTGEKIEIKASKVPVFKAGKILKETVNS